MFDRKAFILAAAIAVIGANSLALSPIAGAIARSFPGVDAAGVMRATAAYGLATAFSALVLAPAIDGVGRVRALVRALSAWVVALVATALAPNLPLLCLAQALAGLAAGCALPAVYALSTQLAQKGHEKQTMGVVLVGWTASLVVGGSMAALLADRVQWRLVFAALALAGGCVVLALRRAGDWPAQAPHAGEDSPLAALRVPGIKPLLVLVGTYMTAFYGLYTYLGPHITEGLGLSTASAGLAPLAYGLGFGAAAFAGRLLDRHEAATVIPGVFVCLALIYLALAAFSRHGLVLVAFGIAWGLANHLGVNLIITRLTALDPGRSGAIMGLYSAVTYGAVLAGAAAYQPIFRSAGFAACAMVSAGCMAAALVVATAQARRSPSPKGRGVVPDR